MCVVCVCGMCVWYVCVVCVCSVYVWFVCVVCMCGMVVWCVQPRCDGLFVDTRPLLALRLPTFLLLFADIGIFLQKFAPRKTSLSAKRQAV